MKRSEINAAIEEATAAFARHGWILPPNPRWDITDFGLGRFAETGLSLVNLAEQPEYCEKIMYVRQGQVTPAHCHRSKKEDIVCRWGRLAIEILADTPSLPLLVNGELRDVPCGRPFFLESGERITLTPGVRHAFWADSGYAIVGEVSTANDDRRDNVFDNPDVGRFSSIEEDEPPLFRLVSEPSP